MKTRIRYYRKLRRWTQSELARQAGTTAATISRLETADMNVSMDWLEKFAGIFTVPVVALIDERRPATTIPCVGIINRAGNLSSMGEDDEEDVMLEAMARDPIALHISENFGLYRAGDIVIADRMSTDDLPRALGRDCLVEIEGEGQGFGRFISSGHGTYLLVPPEPGSQARHVPLPDWVAPVVMLIRHF
ncbi:MAG: helix-turn-helix domain-containing protein [Parvibaculaceae bacterium]